MRIAISNTMSSVKVSTPAVKRLVAFLCSSAGLKLDELSLALINDEQIVEVNRKHLKHSYVTDVISYILPALPGGSGMPSAELYINIQLACSRKTRRGWDSRNEFALYIAHGIDHLSGEDDAGSKGYRRMRRRELSWLRLARKKGLLKDLMRIRFNHKKKSMKRPPREAGPYKSGISEHKNKNLHS